MANLTVSADGVIRDGNRVSVRTSTGRVYVCYTNTNDGIFMSKGNVDGEPASFSVADSITGITLLLEQGMACAIDSLDIIHCMFIVLNSNHSGIIAVRYVQFDTSTDTFGSPETIQLLDASLNQLAIRENMGIALDSNDDPHVIWKDVDTNMGADTWTNYYSNKTGASWRTRVAIFTGITSDEIIAYDIMVADPLSSVNADRPIIVMYDDGTALAINVYYGDALDSTAFTEELDVTGSTVVGGGHVSFAIDSNEKITIAFVEETTRDLMIVEHLNASAWTSWETPIQVASDFNYDSPSIAITCGTDRYIFVTNANDDIRLWKDNGSGWTQETDDTDLPNIGTFNDVKVKWARSQFNFLATYYFDAFTTIIDNDAWNDDTDAFDGGTFAFASEPTGAGQANSLEGHGTTAPGSGTAFSRVKARIWYKTSATSNLILRIYDDGQGETLLDETLGTKFLSNGGWSPYFTVTEPSGGWTYAELQALECEFWVGGGTITADNRVYKIEFDVTEEIQSLELDYLFEDASGNLLYNTWLAPCDAVVRSEFWHGHIPQPLF
jgi:hypothetical protein